MTPLQYYGDVIEMYIAIHMADISAYRAQQNNSLRNDDTSLIAERLSARWIILHCISEIVFMHVCMCVCMYISVTLLREVNVVYFTVARHILYVRVYCNSWYSSRVYGKFSCAPDVVYFTATRRIWSTHFIREGIHSITLYCMGWSKRRNRKWGNGK